MNNVKMKLLSPGTTSKALGMKKAVPKKPVLKGSVKIAAAKKAGVYKAVGKKAGVYKAVPKVHSKPPPPAPVPSAGAQAPVPKVPICGMWAASPPRHLGQLN